MRARFTRNKLAVAQYTAADVPEIAGSSPRIQAIRINFTSGQTLFPGELESQDSPQSPEKSKLPRSERHGDTGTYFSSRGSLVLNVNN